jgi:hypothetical protein
MKQQEMYKYIVSLREYIISLEKRVANLEAKLEQKTESRPPSGTGRRSMDRQAIQSMLDGMVGTRIPIPTKEDLKF